VAALVRGEETLAVMPLRQPQPHNGGAGTN